MNATKDETAHDIGAYVGKLLAAKNRQLVLDVLGRAKGGWIDAW